MLSEKEMSSLLGRIPEASHEQICEILEEIRKWDKRNFPNWEIAYLALPLDNAAQRANILENAFAAMSKVPDAENSK